jgi:hypothetical protein
MIFRHGSQGIHFHPFPSVAPCEGGFPWSFPRPEGLIFIHKSKKIAVTEISAGHGAGIALELLAPKDGKPANTKTLIRS